MKKNEEKSAMGKKRGRGRGRPRKNVQTRVGGSESSHDQYFPSSASLKYKVGDPSRYTLRSKEVDNQGREDTSPIQNQNVSAKKLHKLNTKAKALNFLYSEKFNDDNLFSVRVDVEESVTTKRAQKTSVANFKEMKSVMNPGPSRAVTEIVNTRCASITYRGSLRDDDDDDDDDDEIEVGANVAENVIPECAENTSIAHGLNVTEKAGLMNRGLRDVKVDDGDGVDEAEPCMHTVFGNVKVEGADVTENVATEKTSIARSFNITEIASRMNRGRRRDEDDEIVSSLHPISVNLKGYRVKQETAPLFAMILTKHGDIGKNCKIKCPDARGCLVDLLCSVYQRLEDTNLMDVTDVELEGMKANVSLLHIQNFDVGWLSERLDDIRVTKTMFKEHTSLRREKAEKEEAVSKKKKEMDEYSKKWSTAEAELGVLEADLVKINQKNDSLKEKGTAYLNKSLVHGLV